MPNLSTKSQSFTIHKSHVRPQSQSREEMEAGLLRSEKPGLLGVDSNYEIVKHGAPKKGH